MSVTQTALSFIGAEGGLRTTLDVKKLFVYGRCGCRVGVFYTISPYKIVMLIPQVDILSVF